MNSAQIQHAASILRKGGVVAFPTETVYGLGANALNVQACARIFEIKNRPFFDPLIVHVAGLDVLESVCVLNAHAEKLIKSFWPGPLTLVLLKKNKIPDLVTAGLSTVALRFPDHPHALELIRKAGVPIAAPSANPFGYLSPTTAEHVRAQIGNKVDLILDGGPCCIGVESTILDLSGSSIRLLRPGGIAIETIEAMIGKIDKDFPKGQGFPKGDKPLAPGQFPFHYSPHTKLRLLEKPRLRFQKSKHLGLLSFTGSTPKISAYTHVEILSKKGDLREAAANLFSCLHRLDTWKLDSIDAEPVPSSGLGHAILDRLRKAARRVSDTP
jgi:L-threonylcarbamoyladenylate synthase